MNTLLAQLAQNCHLSQVAALAAEMKIETFLVGGAVRNLLIGIPLKDYDFAVAGDPAPLAQALAGRSGGSFFWLDRERRQARVVVKEGSGTFTWDFAPFRATDISADLALRDFTINAIAVELDTRKVIDPLNGCRDIRHGIIRSCSSSAFIDDPLRLLRAFRFAATLDFSIEEETRQLIDRDAHLLPAVAGERIRDEMAAILSIPRSASVVAALLQQKLLNVVVPAPIDPSTPGFLGRLESLLCSISELVRALGNEIENHLAREIEQGVSAKVLVKLMVLQGKNRVHGLADALKLGTCARRFMERFAAGAGSLVHAAPSVTTRSLFRILRDHEPAAVELILNSLIPCLDGEPVPPLATALLEFYFHRYDSCPADLLSGRELMDSLGIPQGPEVGKVVELLRDGERQGLVNDRDSAWAFLAKNQLTKG
jgi:poly(A) polymerase